MDSLQATEEALLKERNRLEIENIHLIEERKKSSEKLQEFQASSSQKLELLEKAWKKEKTALEVCYVLMQKNIVIDHTVDSYKELGVARKYGIVRSIQ